MNSHESRIMIHSGDDIARIFARISESSDREITLESPNRSIVYAPFVLRLILARFPDKRFTLVTADSDLRRIAELLGIRVYTRNESREFEDEFSKSNILRHNFTFLEYFWYEIRKLFSKIRFTLERRQKKNLRFRSNKILAETNLILLVMGVILSLSLLIFIFYFAVSKTTITITPDFAVKTVSQNLIYQEWEAQSVLDTRPIIPVRRMEVVASSENLYNVSTFDIDSVRAAKWVVEVYNEMQSEQVFRPNTRFVTPEWLVFRSTEWIKIPPTRTASGEVVIGRANSILVSDGYDTKWELMGIRGNISEGTLLDIPGLRFNRDKIYAKAIKNFEWGQNPTIKVLTEDELKKFQWLLIDSLKTKAFSDLKAKIAEENRLSNQLYDILDIPDNIRYGDPVITIKNNVKAGDRISEVTLAGTMKVSTYLYDKNTAFVILKALLGEKLLYGTEKLHEILNDSLKISAVIARQDTPQFGLKWTTELSATISYNFEDDSNALTKRLKNLVAGMSIEEATSILLNNNNIAKVRIRLSPFWLRYVSSSPDNIEFVIEK